MNHGIQNICPCLYLINKSNEHYHSNKMQIKLSIHCFKRKVLIKTKQCFIIHKFGEEKFHLLDIFINPISNTGLLLKGRLCKNNIWRLCVFSKCFFLGLTTKPFIINNFAE